MKRDRSLTVLVDFRPGGRIRDIKRPYDLEALEHGEDLVVYLERFTRRLPSDIAAMGIEPPLSRAVPFPLLPSKRLVDLRERLNRLPRWFAGWTVDDLRR